MVSIGLTYSSTVAQKPALGISSFAAWPRIMNEKISDDGKYVVYNLFSKGKTQLCVRYSDGRKLIDFETGKAVTFLLSGDKLFSLLPGDSLFIFSFSSRKVRYIAHVTSFKIPTSDGGKWVAWMIKGAERELQVYNLCLDSPTSYSNVGDYFFSKSGRILVLGTGVEGVDDTLTELRWINLEKGLERVAWKGKSFSNLVFNPSETALAFAGVTGGRTENETGIWYFTEEADSANEWVETGSPGMEGGYEFGSGNMVFSPDGMRLFFYLRHRAVAAVVNNQLPTVHIWNSRDEMLRPLKDKEYEINRSRPYLAYCTLHIDSVIKLERETDSRFFPLRVSQGGNGIYAIASHVGNIYEGYLRNYLYPDIELIRLSDGKRTVIARNQNLLGIHASPGGRFVLWYEMSQRAYFVYDIQSATARNITKGIPTKMYTELWDEAKAASPYGDVGWVKDDKWVLIQDRFDIWKVDPLGKEAPVNITRGFGRRNRIILRYLPANQPTVEGPFFDTTSIAGDGKLLLCALNDVTKDNGFFQTEVSGSKDPMKLVMSPDVYYFNENQSGVEFGRELIRAVNKDVYLIRKSNVNDFPNLQITNNFARFTPITDFQPEREVNWMSSELVKWRVKGDIYSQGILYKPEDFDSKKTYPVIIYMYERLSDGLNQFIFPTPSTGPLPISIFVSNGYIVFCPDIRYKVGNSGQSVGDYILSAVQRLRKYSWINRSKIGVQGHSMGGYEVNWLVTHTHLFAAAASAAGVSNLISLSSTDRVDYTEPHASVEEGQNRMGKSLWQDFAAYVRSSPVLTADKATTPLLMMHNLNDTNVPWNQAYDLFTSLRWLHKKVWLLQYDGETHTLHNAQNQTDYTQRLLDYFGYYLKNGLEPQWMHDYIH